MSVKEFLDSCINRNGGNLVHLQKVFSVSSYLWRLLKEGGVAMFFALLHKNVRIKQLYKLGKGARVALQELCSAYRPVFPEGDLILMDKIRRTFLPEINLGFLKMKLESTSSEYESSFLESPTIPSKRALELSDNAFESAPSDPTQKDPIQENPTSTETPLASRLRSKKRLQ